MTFKLYSCKGPDGLPLIEVPDEGLIAERLSPGTIREPDFYDNFVQKKQGDAVLLFACPIGKTKRGKCEGGQRLLRVRHKRENLRQLLRECKSGGLSRRRIREIRKILDDVKHGSPMGESVRRISVAAGGNHALFAPSMIATTPMGRLVQFGLTSLITVVMFMIWLRIFWPEDAPTGARRRESA